MSFKEKLERKKPIIEGIFANPAPIATEDQYTWGTLFHALHPILKAHSMVYGARESQVDDITQETWIELSKRYTSGTFDFSGSPLGYALTVNFSKVRNSQRHNARFDKRSNPLPNEPEVLDLRSPEVEHLEGEVSPAIIGALQQIDPHFRTPFLLAAMHNLSQAEIAELLDVKEDTVKTRIHRARTQLKKILMDEAA